ncbi:SDR family oxidoreductase [Alphaproteobacteria bacterium]|nr:SDR family oxidoreductase [Alphaproteobacteria bacterium]
MVFHIAARTDLNGVEISEYDTNTIGVENIIKVLAGVHELQLAVFLSSMLVCKLGYTPKNPIDFCLSTTYGKSKVIGEQAVPKYGKYLPWVILRPTSLWEPWFGSPYRDFFDVLTRGFYFHPKGVRVYRSYRFVLNAIEAMYKMAVEISHDILLKQVYYVADPEPIELYA